MGCRRNARAYFTFFTVTVSVMVLVAALNLADLSIITDDVRKSAAGLGLLVAMSGIVGIPLLVQNCYARRQRLLRETEASQEKADEEELTLAAQPRRRRRPARRRRVYVPSE